CINVIDDEFIAVKRKDIYYNTPIMTIFRILGYIFIEDHKMYTAVDQLNKKVPKILKEEKKSLVIFPEGRRGLRSEIGVFKKGGFHLAYQNKVQIRRCVIKNFENIFDETNFSLFPGTIKVDFMDPIPKESFSENEIDR
ncbi:MAG: hypothetical protein MHPSP_002538, partial [Paramarteilia canceri]